MQGTYGGESRDARLIEEEARRKLEILQGVADVWIVWRDEHPPDGGHPKFLAAYCGDRAERSAKALVDLLTNACAPGQVEASRVPLWPLLREAISQPSP